MRVSPSLLSRGILCWLFCENSFLIASTAALTGGDSSVGVALSVVGFVSLSADDDIPALVG